MKEKEPHQPLTIEEEVESRLIWIPKNLERDLKEWYVKDAGKEEKKKKEDPLQVAIERNKMWREADNLLLLFFGVQPE